VPAPVAAAANFTAAADAIRRASPFLCFLARVVEHLEADSAPLSSYTGVLACLRAALAHKFTGISVAERQQLQRALERTFTPFSDPIVVFALVFWTLSGAPCAAGYWCSGGVARPWPNAGCCSRQPLRRGRVYKDSPVGRHGGLYGH